MWTQQASLKSTKPSLPKAVVDEKQQQISAIHTTLRSLANQLELVVSPSTVIEMPTSCNRLLLTQPDNYARHSSKCQSFLRQDLLYFSLQVLKSNKDKVAQVKSLLIGKALEWAFWMKEINVSCSKTKFSRNLQFCMLATL